MYWLNMSLQIPILGSLIITLIARISDFFMYRLNMNLQISLCRSLMVTLITRIFDLTLLASVQAGEHLLGQGCPVLFITLSSLILAGKWGGSRVQWGGWSFFRAFGHSSPWAELELVGKGEVLWNETRTVNSQTLTDHFTSSREYRERRGVFTRAPTCPLVTTLSPSLWCCLPSFSLSQNIYILSPYYNINRGTSTQLPW